VSEPVARLVELHDDRRGRSHELGLGVHVLGRHGGADIILDHVDVSRRHAELEITLDGATIRDLGSKNGVVVGHRKVDAATLDDGSRVAIGELKLILEHPGARVDRLLARSGEPTVRGTRPPSTAVSVRASRPLLGPLLAALIFALLLIGLLVFG
jgi:pSer/pThr/pTyr-binding forkhead associated (FHA) protein